MNQDWQERVPEHSDIERLVLGAAMTEQESFARIADVLKASDFFPEKHKRIFLCMQELFERGELLNYVSVAKALEEAGQLQSVDGLSYLASLTDGMPHLVSIENFCQKVRDASIKRQAIQSMQLLIERCCNPGDETAELAIEAERVVETLNNTNRRELAARSYEQGVADTGGVNKFLSPETKCGIHIPFDSIHQTLIGLRRPKLIILGARPAVGKSALAIQIAEHAAANGNNVLFVTLEMSLEDVLLRSMTGRAGVGAYKFRTGHLDQRERHALQATLAELVEKSGERLLLVDRSDTTVLGISNLLRSLKARGRPVELCVIDYLQLLSSSNRFENRVQEVSSISRGLKKIAQEFRIPVLALSQLKRADESRKNERPELDWLKESGQLEQDADQVLFLWTKRDPEEGETVREIHWRVAKNRDGMLNHGTLTFNTRFCRFVEDGNESEAAA